MARVDQPMRQACCSTPCCVAQALAGLSDALRSDMYLHPHFKHYMREVRVVAYSQVRAWGRGCVGKGPREQVHCAGQPALLGSHDWHASWKSEETRPSPFRFPPGATR